MYFQPEQLNAVLGISVGITGAIIGWITVLRPLWSAHKAWKERKKKALADCIAQDTAYRKLVLDKLEALETTTKATDRSVAYLQRDNIERAYCMFVVEHGYCTSGMKEAIFDTYQSYTARGYNRIAKSRIDEILALPEYPSTSRKGNI